MESKETQAKQKKEQLFMKSKHGATRISAETQKQSDAFAADYMAFLNASKTEREAAKNAAAKSVQPHCRSVSRKPVAGS